MGLGILTDKQETALRLERRLGSVSAVAEAMGIKEPAASRLLARAKIKLRAMNVVFAIGGDALDAMNEARKVLAF